MARKNSDEEKSSFGDSDSHHAQLLYRSLEQYNEDQKRSRRPSFVLAALVFLFVSSSAGVALSIILMLQPAEVQTPCIARDLVLFAAVMSLLYICIHVRGARKDYRRRGTGPPQIYGQYLHASALLVARLGIAVWVAALVATAIVISKAAPMAGLAKVAPYLNLVICIGALPPFILISATIERYTTPFATTGLSADSFLTRRVSQFGDDELTPDLSVSRRASLQRKQSNSASIITLPSAEIFQYGMSKPPETSRRIPEPVVTAAGESANDEAELMANSPVGPTYNTPVGPRTMPPPPVIPPIPKIPLSLSKSPPQPVYNPGGWRNEWDHGPEKIEVKRNANKSPDNSSTGRSTADYSSTYSSTMSANSSQTPMRANAPSGTSSVYRATPSTSIASSARRSRLSTVRYASKPEIAVRQEIRVIKNPHYSPARGISQDKSRETVMPLEPAAMLRGSQHAQRRVAPPLRRKQSNFSRPIPSSKSSRADSAVDMTVPRTSNNEISRG
ncbi:hypothetical protein GGS23DRAFT_77119 [Durotheca rogersii]|uniref:uncharacterized protein n=1 Tax=Durotheca rogersii TaxID=419775 RepID=UPI00221F73FF|nr:uncharacterized protein GGS23DRAFT_77119 [Durotheca rogersii]KAI5862964.1 hypothetical protein GGS23DRAFT_77119 [Durotheca rogersii]